MVHVLSSHDVKADPEKISAIINFPVPHDRGTDHEEKVYRYGEIFREI